MVDMTIATIWFSSRKSSSLFVVPLYASLLVQGFTLPPTAAAVQVEIHLRGLATHPPPIPERVLVYGYPVPWGWLLC